MKKIFTVFILLLGVSSVFSQNYNWITPNQSYLKMYVVSDGMYRIEKNDFVNAGISVASIDPRTVKVYYKGNQIPIYFYGEGDGVFDDADYFDFYGKRNYGGLTNTYDENDNVVYSTNEYYNLYSDTSVYWIGWNGSYGLRFTDYNNSSSLQYSYDYYYKTLRFENDFVYNNGECINIYSDERFYETEKFRGEGWYWMLMQNGNTINQTFNANFLSNTPQQCRLKLFAYPASQDTAIYNEHRLVIKVNNTQLDTLKTDNFNRLDTMIYFSSSSLTAGANISIVRYLPVNTGMTMYFDFFEISYTRRFEFDSNYICFNSELTDSARLRFFVKGVVSANPVSIYDTKNGNRISNYNISNDTLYFIGRGNGNYEINNKPITKKPFRIKQKQVPPLVMNSTGADYIVVYNKLFETQAEQLRSYRNTHDGFRSFKAEIEDVYDVFNYGMEDPAAVRNFTKNAFDTWTQPKIKYLCLFGRGSIDPKKNLTSSLYYQNYIPVYGNPASDGYFVNFNTGTFVYSHQISVGRLPVYTTQEAQDMVNKIISYESSGLSAWNKKHLFITGGYSVSEQQAANDYANYFISTYIAPLPTSSGVTKIYLNDPSGNVTYNYSDSVRHSIDRGALIVNFMAHTSWGYWSNCFEDPVVLANNNKYPLVLSMTCLSGKNAVPGFRGYGEKFAFYPGKGSIGFIATTGWAFSGTTNSYQDYLLSSFSLDTLRRTGDILRAASVKMSVINSFESRNTVNSFNLLGDPAVKLNFPAYPEFDVENTDYLLSDVNPPVKKNLNLYVYPRNLGTNADSCKIRFQVLRNNRAIKTKDTILHNFGFADTLLYVFSLDTTGNYNLKVVMDPENWNTKENKSNNILNVPVSVRNISFVPLKPEDNQVVNKDSVVFEGVNPNIDLRRNSLKLQLQIDTSLNFNSGLRLTYNTSYVSGVVTTFKAPLPILDSNVVYFWRMNSIVNNSDSSVWTETRRFSYSPNIQYPDSQIIVRKFKNTQYDISELNQISNSGYNLILNSYTGSITASSFSAINSDPTYMFVNNFFYYYLGDTTKNGLRMLKVSKSTGCILDYKKIRFTSTSSSDSVVSFLTTFDTSHILVLVKMAPNGASANLNTTAKFLLRQLGSLYADSVNIPAWGRWSFISYRGLPNPITAESYKPTTNPWDAATCLMNPVFLYPSGTITNLLGPAQSWQNFNWNQALNPYTNIKFDVIGIQHNNNETILMSDVTTNNLVDLQGINSFQYPRLKLITKLALDTVSGALSPLYKGMNFKYIGPPEIALDNNSIFKSDSIVTMGDSVGIGGRYFNVGYVPLNSHVRSFYALDGAGNKVILKTDTVHTPLKVDSSMYVKASFKVNGLPIYKKYLNQIAIVMEVSGINQNDEYEYNNSVISSFYVKGSLAEFQTEVYSDGTRLFGNDYVRSTPDLLIKLTGKSLEQLISSDTTIFRIMLNNQFVSLFGNPKPSSNAAISKDIDKGNMLVRFTPLLKNGLNYLNLITNKGGGNFDTMKFILNVTSEISLKDVFNYPNPMKDNTTFTFTVTGSEQPGEGKIKIFSVAGRVIKTINVNLSIGYNRIYWDGKDADGDYIANGVYLYKLIIEGNNKKETALQKLVVLK